MTPRGLLERGEAELALALSTEKLDALVAYATLLEKWNRTYNLTAIRDPRRVMTHHVLDALAVLAHLPAGALADVGSGAGLPGIPIAIAQPARALALVEANAKKAAFLRQAKIELALDNADVHESRVESLRPGPGFDAVIARGFADLAEFADSCRHLLAQGGALLAMKGTYPRDEIARLPRHVEVRDVIELRVPFVDAARHLVMMRVHGA